MKTPRQTLFLNRTLLLSSLFLALGSAPLCGQAPAESYDFFVYDDAYSSGCRPQKTCSWQVDAEFLYWYSDITNLSYALKGVTIESGDEVPDRTVYVPKRREHFGTSWDPGLRIGLGYINHCSCWEVNADWTYYNSCTKSSTSVPAFDNSNFVSNDQPFQPPGVEALKSPWLLTPNSDFYNDISANWQVVLNQFDLEAARTFCFNSCLNIRPYAGLRAYWTTIDFDVFASRPLRSNATLLRSSSRFTQSDWGLGFLIGVDTAWRLNSCFSIFSETSAALAYGGQSITRKSKEFEQNSSGDTVRDSKAKTEDNSCGMQPILDMALGVRWETLCSCYKVCIDLGWEFHYFYDLNQIFRSAGSNSGNEDLVPASGNLGLSGLTIRGRVDF